MNVIDPVKPLASELARDYQGFLSVFGWVHFILFGSFLYYAFAGIFQMNWIMEPSEHLFQYFSENGGNSLVPQNMKNIQSAVLASYYALALFSLFMVVSALGLLKQKNWARLLYNISVLGILVAGTGCGYYFYQKYTSFLVDVAASQDQVWSAFDGVAKFFILVRLVFLIILFFALIRGVILLNRQEMIDYLNSDSIKAISP